MAKNSKSLLNQTSKKSKKEDKYKETSDIKKEYKYNIEDKLVYTGFKTDFRGLECSIIKRSTKKGIHHYTIKFEEEELDGVIVEFLKTPDEYELWLLEQDKESEIKDDQTDMSEMELEMIKNGIEPMKNKYSCHNSLLFYHRDCQSCGYEKCCIYYKKYQYDKVKFN